MQVDGESNRVLVKRFLVEAFPSIYLINAGKVDLACTSQVYMFSVIYLSAYKICTYTLFYVMKFADYSQVYVYDDGARSEQEVT